MSIKSIYITVLVYMLALELGCLVQACGIDWELPHSHFDGVDAQGHVYYSEKFGELDIGNDFMIPLYMDFESDREAVSPYFGKGFEFCLLESRFVQSSENSFKMYQPDGWVREFGRQYSTDTRLNGQGDWKAEISGDTITAWAPCGWKLGFLKGHIVSMTTPKSQKLEFVYSGNVVTAIRENGVNQLTAEQDSTGVVKAFQFNGKRMEIALDQKPRVQNIAGRNVVGGMDHSLRTLTPTDGSSKSFEFAVNDKIQPTLKITNKADAVRLFTWDPETKRIVSDNDWIYKITQEGNGLDDAGISRVNGKNQIEYWFYDGATGQETTLGADGVKKVKTCFISGMTAGKIKKIEETRNGMTALVYRPTYDESGRLLREISYNTVGVPMSKTDWTYDNKHNLEFACTRTGNVTKYFSRQRDANGRLVTTEFYSSGDILVTTVNP